MASSFVGVLLATASRGECSSGPFHHLWNCRSIGERETCTQATIFKSKINMRNFICLGMVMLKV